MVSFHKLIENKVLFYGVQSLIPVILALFIILVRLIQNKINMEIEPVFVALYTFASDFLGYRQVYLWPVDHFVYVANYYVSYFSEMFRT